MTVGSGQELQAPREADQPQAEVSIEQEKQGEKTHEDKSSRFYA